MLMLTGVAPLQTAGPDDVSFLDNRNYATALAETRAGAVIVQPDMADQVPPSGSGPRLAEPYAAWAGSPRCSIPPPPVRPGIHPSAVVAPMHRRCQSPRSAHWR